MSKISRSQLLHRLSQDHLLITGLATCILLIIAQWLILLIYIWQLPPEVPLYYSLPIGIDQLVHRYYLILPPLIATLSLLTWLILFQLGSNLMLFFHQLSLWLTALIIFISAIALLHVIIIIY